MPCTGAISSSVCRWCRSAATSSSGPQLAAGCPASNDSCPGSWSDVETAIAPNCDGGDGVGQRRHLAVGSSSAAPGEPGTSLALWPPANWPGHHRRRTASDRTPLVDLTWWRLSIGLVGRGGFEPPKAMPADLQSAPFGHSGTDPGTGHGSASGGASTTRETRAAGPHGARYVPAVPYPNYEGKHAHDALTEPASFVRYWTEQGALPEGFVAPDGVVVLYQNPLFEAVRRGDGTSPFAPRGRRDTAFLGLHTFDDTGGTVGVIGGFGIGAPAATSVLESLTAIGVQRFVTVGTAGGLTARLDTGDVVVCDRAVRDEGVSHHYAPHALWAEPSTPLTARLRQSLDDAGLVPTPGSAWTIDAPSPDTV